jgi:hypothetical protein
VVRRALAIIGLLALLSGAAAAQTPLDQTRARLAVIVTVYNQAFALMETLRRARKADGSPRLSEADYLAGRRLAELSLREYYHFVTPWGEFIGFDTSPYQAKTDNFASFILEKAAESGE